MRLSSPLELATAALGAIGLLISSLPRTQGASITPVLPPSIDVGKLGGRVALAGNFDAISLYSYVGQTQGINSNGSQSILSPLPNGGYAALSSADANINTMCNFVMKDGTTAGNIVAGNFTSIGGIDAQAIALFDPSKGSITPLPGVFGSVNTILCDQETNSVYVGGEFRAANSTNAIAWVGMTGWANLPFAGFNGPVNSITKAPNGHIVFGGKFTGLSNATLPTQRDQQIINIQSANVTATQTTTQAGLDDPNNIKCPSNGNTGPGHTWLLKDDSTGSIQINMEFGFIPTMVRIYNARYDGRGTKHFRFVALPDTGIMNLTHVDPATNQNVSCTNGCQLSPNATYEDFHFVNPIGMNGLRIDVLDWYGASGGLSGVELFQDEIIAYAINDYNEPKCADIPNASNSTATGPWTQTISGSSKASYLTADVSSTNANSTSIIFKPNIRQSGNYTVTVYTPGCLQDSTCSSRGIVNVTGTMTTSGARSFSTRVFQTNNYDKYDQVYVGQIDAASGSFAPTVTISPSSLQGNQFLVASRIRFEILSSDGGLNGMFEYNPNQAVVDQDLSKSAINTAGTKLKPDAVVNALITRGDTIYSGGSFSDDVFDNVMQFSNNSANSLPGGGLNGAVEDMYDDGNVLFLAGNFTQTNTGGSTGLNNIATYNPSSSEWAAIGAGLNARVTAIVPLQLNVSGSQESVLTFNGDFTLINAFRGNVAHDVQGLAIWVPSRSNWLQNLNIPQARLAGRLSATTNVTNGTALVAGTLASQGQAISGAASLTDYSGPVALGQLPVNIQPNTATSSSLSKRATRERQNVTGVASGRYYGDNNSNLTILGGHFSAKASDGSTIQNLLFLNGKNNDTVTGLPSGLNDNSTFLAMDITDHYLYAGGSISGRIGNGNVGGVIIYDLSTSGFYSTQPAALQGDDVIVEAVAARPSSSEVYVGGSFKSAGSLACPGLCMYQISSGQWTVPGSGFNGNVSALAWTDDKNLVVAGNLTISGNGTSMATYNAKSQTWSTMDTTDVPGPITAIANGGNTNSRMWVSGTASNGTTFLIEKMNKGFVPVTDVFDQNTQIRGMQVIPITKSHADTNMLGGNELLLVCGQLNLQHFGPASAAVYNGTTMTPFILASTSNGQGGSIARLVSQQNYIPSGGESEYTSCNILNYANSV